MQGLASCCFGCLSEETYQIKMIAILDRNNTAIDNQWLTSGVLCHTQLNQCRCLRFYYFIFLQKEVLGRQKNLIQPSQKLKLGKHQAQMDLLLVFVLTNNILCSKCRIAYFWSGSRHILCLMGICYFNQPQSGKRPTLTSPVKTMSKYY